MKEEKGKSRSHPFQYLQHIPLKTELFEKKKEEKTAHTGSEMSVCVCVFVFESECACGWVCVCVWECVCMGVRAEG